jgi:hypothetical protein
MENEELERLRALLAINLERRRPGVWRLVRRVAVFLNILRVVFGRRHRN